MENVHTGRLTYIAHFGENNANFAVKELATIKKFNAGDVKVSVLTKGILPAELADFGESNEYGISLVSLSEDFRKQYEPFSAPYVKRIERLKHLHKNGCKTWVSIEPYPTPNIFDQDLEEILQAVSFVDKIVFGKWNYNNAATQYPNAKNFYNACANEVIDFCELHDIECFIKKGTVSEINLFDCNGCRLKLGDTVRISANEVNIYGNFTPDDDNFWEFDETGVVTFDSDTNCFELVSEVCLEYAYWNLNHDFPSGMKIPFLEVLKEVNYA